VGLSTEAVRASDANTTVKVDGDVVSKRYTTVADNGIGVFAMTGAVVEVGGSVTSTINNGTGVIASLAVVSITGGVTANGNGVAASGEGGIVTVGENVISTLPAVLLPPARFNAVLASAGGKVFVVGNVTAADTGVKGMAGGEVRIDGEIITSTPEAIYILFEYRDGITPITVPKIKEDGVPAVAPNLGYMEFMFANPGNPSEISIVYVGNIAVAVPPPVLSAGNVNRTSDTEATVGFTTDTAGTAYYLVLDGGASVPTGAEVKAANNSLGAVSAGTVTGRTVTLTAGEKDIYVVVDDAAGNISTPLLIKATAFVTVPPTGIPGITGAMTAMIMFLAISAGLWGYMLRPRLRGNNT
jgi:hypothetical protein